MLGTKSHGRDPLAAPCSRLSRTRSLPGMRFMPPTGFLPPVQPAVGEVRATSRSLTHGEVPHVPAARAGSRRFPLTGIRSVGFTRAK